jgi:hypothetical protein
LLCNGVGMTPEEDAAALEIELDSNGRLVPITREKAAAVLRHWARSDAPSRFAVFEILPDEEGPGFDGRIIAWGLGYEDHIEVQSVEPGMGGRFRSTSSMAFLFGQSIEVLWIDPEPVSAEDESTPCAGCAAESPTRSTTPELAQTSLPAAG